MQIFINNFSKIRHSAIKGTTKHISETRTKIEKS